MNLWPFRRQPKKTKWAINLHGSLGANVSVAATWTTYAGTKALVRMGDYFDLHPEARGHQSPFDEESYARDVMAEFWEVQPADTQVIDTYLQLLAYAFLLSLLEGSLLWLRQQILRQFYHRTVERSRETAAPLYRLRSALSRLWQDYPQDRANRLYQIRDDSCLPFVCAGYLPSHFLIR